MKRPSKAITLLKPIIKDIQENDQPGPGQIEIPVIRFHPNPAASQPVPPLQDHFAQVSYALAHEIRNPLSNINLATGLLEHSIRDKALHTYLDIILRSSLRINQILTEFLNHQKANDSKTGKHLVPDLIDEVLEKLRDRILFKKIQVSQSYTTPDVSLEMNRSEMMMAFMNIIVNAIDAMETGGQLDIVTREGRNKYMVEIRDNGCGISPENLKNIFKAYYTNKPGGLGVGLSTTHDILWSNHVEVKVESELGTGTCFTLLFDKDPNPRREK